MQVSVTIPQFFYDLIARAIPGFMFLLMVGLISYGTGTEVLVQGLLSSSAAAALLLALMGGIFSYLMGWVLYSFKLWSFRKKATDEFAAKVEPSLSEMYNHIRIEDDNIGFRITKLRAEARMIETLRVGMLYVVLIAGGLWILSATALLPVTGQTLPLWLLKVLVPAILALAFGKLEKEAWDKYCGNVVSHYKILFEEKTTRDEKPTPEKRVRK